jgi:SAM-dependent methyltransferase
MGTAQLQGSLWGARARDYAAVVEALFRPVYERVIDETAVGPGTRLLDVGCGPGLAAQLAAARGACVAGLDAAEASLAIARERIPAGDFRQGEMEELPWPDGTFDVVTSFNAFQFAADLEHALREARRVTAAAGRVAMVVWGHDEDCEVAGLMAALRELLPPRPTNVQAGVPLSTPGRMEALLDQAGLTPRSGGDVDCPFTFADLETAVRGFMSAGAAVAIVQRVGAEPVERALVEALTPFRTSVGGYSLRNRFRYVIAAAIAPAASGPHPHRGERT